MTYRAGLFLFLSGISCSTALYATVPYTLNAYADTTANTTGRPYDSVDCLKRGYVCELPPRNIDRPNDATTVYVQIDMLEISSVDEISGTFIADFLFHMAWRDDRIECVPEVLAATKGIVCQETVGESEYITDFRQFFPRLDIMNAVEKAFDGEPIELIVKQRRPVWLVNQNWTTVAPDGPDNYESLSQGSWVLGHCRQRIALSTKMTLTRYPFDGQNLSVVLQAEDFESEDVRIVASPVNLNSFVPNLAINGWSVKGVDIQHVNKVYTYSEATFSNVILTVMVTRTSGQLLSRYVLGVSFLVFMAFLAITLEPNNPNRQTMQQASFLGTVAWQCACFVWRG